MAYLELAQEPRPAYPPGPNQWAAFPDSGDSGRVRNLYPNGAKGTPVQGGAILQNLLINGDFRFAQRQTPGSATSLGTTTTTRAYGFDRWCITANANPTLRRDEHDSATPMPGLTSRYYGRISIGGSNKFLMMQIVEGNNTVPLRGRAVRVSCKMRLEVVTEVEKDMRLYLLSHGGAGTIDSVPVSIAGGTLGGAGFDPSWTSNITAITPRLMQTGYLEQKGMTCRIKYEEWRTFSAVFDVPSDAKNLIVVIANRNPENFIFHVTECGLYPTEEIIQWEPRSHEQELEFCERFCQKTFNVDTNPAQNAGVDTGEFKWIAWTGFGAAGRSPSYQFRTPMRTAPAVTTYNPDAASAQVRNEKDAADCSAVAVVGATENGLAVTYTGNAAQTIGDLLGLHLLMEAEL